MDLKEQVKRFFLSNRKYGNWFAIHELPTKDWGKDGKGISQNNIGTRLPEYAIEKPEGFLEGRKRQGTTYKEWRYYLEGSLF
jgi:hypothetical protein